MRGFHWSRVGRVCSVEKWIFVRDSCSFLCSRAVRISNPQPGSLNRWWTKVFLNCYICMSKLDQSLDVSTPCNLALILLLFCCRSVNKGPSSFHKSYTVQSQQKRSFFIFFELVSRQIKQMTPVFFPNPLVSPHTAYMMLPLHGRTKMATFRRWTDWYMCMHTASKFMVLMKVVSTRNWKWTHRGIYFKNWLERNAGTSEVNS